MAGLRETFPQYQISTEAERQEAITAGLVVVDANVLLDAYRFAPPSRADLLQSLGKLGERLWIPHQVGLEFYNNRINVMSEQVKVYREATERLERVAADIDSSLKEPIRRLAKTVALSESDRDRMIGYIDGGLSELRRDLAELERRHGISSDSLAMDEVLTQIETVLATNVGPPLSDKELEEVRQRAKDRHAKRIPPGYMDKDAASPGDYILWVQLLKEAKKRGLPTLFITRDVKEDWFWRVRGRTVGGRPELIEEAQAEAGVRLIIMETKSFLFHARTHLSVRVSDDTIRQAETLSEIDESDSASSRKVVLHRMRISPRIAEVMRWILQERKRHIDYRLHMMEATNEALEARVSDDPEDLQAATRLADAADALTSMRDEQHRIDRAQHVLSSRIDDSGGRLAWVGPSAEGKYMGQVRDEARRVLSESRKAAPRPEVDDD